MTTLAIYLLGLGMGATFGMVAGRRAGDPREPSTSRSPRPVLEDPDGRDGCHDDDERGLAIRPRDRRGLPHRGRRAGADTMKRPHGADVSQYNVIPMTGLGFVLIRATSADGGLHTDSRLDEHVAEARAHGIPFGLYHFAANGTPAYAQADAIFAAARQHEALHRGSIGIVIDCEGTLDIELAREIIAATKGRLTRQPFSRRQEVGIYSGGWIKSRGGVTLGADWGWLAEWGVTRPTLPTHWHRGFTRLWQYGGSGVDRDLYRGSRRSFERWLAR